MQNEPEKTVLAVLGLSLMTAIMFLLVQLMPLEPPTPRAGNSERNTQEQRSGDTRTTQIGQSQIPSFVNPTSNLETQKPDADKGADYWGTVADWWMIGITIGATALAAIGARIAWRQFKTQRRQTNRALLLARQANRTARLARTDAITASEAALQQAKNEMYLTLRARMGLNQVIKVKFGPNEVGLIKLLFQNYGGKGAFVETHWLNSFVGTVLPPEPTYGSLNTFVAGVQVEAGAEFEIYMTIDPPFSTENWSRIQNGELKFWFYGKIQYQAGFQPELKEVGFCRLYDPQLTQLTGQIVFSTVGSKAYNYAT